MRVGRSFPAAAAACGQKVEFSDIALEKSAPLLPTPGLLAEQNLSTLHF